MFHHCYWLLLLFLGNIHKDDREHLQHDDSDTPGFNTKSIPAIDFCLWRWSSNLLLFIQVSKRRIANSMQNLIQARYEAHRSARNAQYKSKILDVDFPGWSVDEILKKLTSSNSSADGQFIDTRHNLSFWARPPRHIRDLVDEIQQEIRAIAPSQCYYSCYAALL